MSQSVNSILKKGEYLNAVATMIRDDVSIVNYELLNDRLSDEYSYKVIGRYNDVIEERAVHIYNLIRINQRALVDNLVKEIRDDKTLVCINTLEAFVRYKDDAEDMAQSYRSVIMDYTSYIKLYLDENRLGERGQDIDNAYYGKVAYKLFIDARTIGNDAIAKELRHATATDMHATLVRCSVDPKLNHLTYMYKYMKMDNVVGYKPDNVTTFINAMMHAYRCDDIILENELAAEIERMSIKELVDIAEIITLEMLDNEQTIE